MPVWKVKQVNVPPPPSHDTRKDPSDNHIGGGLPVGESSRGERTKEQRKLYQFEANASDDEMEDEIEDNLDEISEATSRLKALGMTMGQELDRQNVHINKIAKKTDQLDDGISATAARVRYYSKLISINLHLIFFLCPAQEDQIDSTYRYLRRQFV